MKVETIAEQLFFITVRIQTDRGVGTDFIFYYKLTEETGLLFLVTNKHVVEGAKTGNFSLIKSDGSSPVFGERFDIEVDDFEKKWFGHPNPNIDISIFPFAILINKLQEHGQKPYFKFISLENIASEKQLNDFDAIEEIVFIGYPIGIYDQKNLLPVARRGITATPISIDYNGQPIFLIDASVFPGSSGSPVFICNVGSYSHRGGLSVGNRLYFLGVVASVFYHRDDGEIDFVDIPTNKIPIIKTRQMINLGVVYKAKTVVETIEAELNKYGVEQFKPCPIS